MYVIVGANGYLGSYIKKAVLEETDDVLICTSRKANTEEKDPRVTWANMDISDKNDVDEFIERLRDYENVKIIITAAYHNPDLVQKNPELAWNINVTSLSYFVNKADFAKEIY